MCGIIGYTGDADATPILVSGLKALEYRGYDSAGIALARTDGIETVKSVGRIAALEKKLSGSNVVGCCGVGHTRWATHGCPTEVNCHPHTSFGGKFALVHNGIIENCRALRLLCEKRGVTLKSDTDSEVVAHLLELEYDGDPMRTLMRVTARLQGSYALGVLCSDFPDEIFAAKQRSPLIVGLGDSLGCVSSDGAAMPNGVDEIVVLADGQAARVSPRGADIFYRGKRVPYERTAFASVKKAAGLDGYTHYMLKEMYEQPEAIARTVTYECRGTGAIRLKRTDISLIGCGSSYHASIAAAPLLERVTGRRVTAALASEFICSEYVSGKGSQCVLLSQSGETADTIAAAEEAERRGYSTLAVANVHASTLTRVCDNAFCTRAGPEISVATTKGFTTQVAALAALAAPLSSDGGLTTDIKTLPFAAEKALADSVKAKRIAPLIAKASCVFFTGRKTDYGTALEGALKLREITYISALGIAAGELKHGSISLIEQGTPVITICTDDALAAKALLSIATVRARGGVVIGVTNNDEVAAACDEVMRVPRVNPLLSAAIAVIPLQRLAYETALLLGRDIDKPRNLAKSVTVE